jgi:LysM repeat protein
VRLIRKPPKGTPRKRLRAGARRSAAKYAEEDYSAEEPNVKLSRAFVIVLLLHVVAVGGIFAFSAMKDRQSGSGAAKRDPATQKSGIAQASGTRDSGALDKASPDKGSGKTVPPDVQKLVDSSHSPAAESTKTQNAGSTQENAGQSTKVYVVQRGDSPAGIAKKFKVSYADLLRTNNIGDPKRLQIGQKLVIP